MPLSFDLDYARMKEVYPDDSLDALLAKGVAWVQKATSNGQQTDIHPLVTVVGMRRDNKLYELIVPTGPDVQALYRLGYGMLQQIWFPVAAMFICPGLGVSLDQAEATMVCKGLIEAPDPEQDERRQEVVHLLAATADGRAASAVIPFTRNESNGIVLGEPDVSNLAWLAEHRKNLFDVTSMLPQPGILKAVFTGAMDSANSIVAQLDSIPEPNPDADILPFGGWYANAPTKPL